MLNIMQRMSGIATMTHKYAEQLKGTNTRVLDTRKTTPGMRILEKMAVKIGGGVNHRIGLFDMILLKDNHVDFAGGIDKAINRAKEYCKGKGKDLKIEIEVRNFDELQQVLDLGGVDRIMFDNFTPAMTKKAVEMVGGRYETESSGGITFDTLRDYAGLLLHDHETALYHFGTGHAECNVHIIRYLRKNSEETKNRWSGELIALLNEMNEARKQRISEGENGFSEEQIKAYEKNTMN